MPTIITGARITAYVIKKDKKYHVHCNDGTCQKFDDLDDAYDERERLVKSKNRVEVSNPTHYSCENPLTMEFRSQTNGKTETIQANLNGFWQTVGEVVQSAPRMFHARFIETPGTFGKGIGIWGDAWKARRHVQKTAEEKFNPIVPTKV